MADANLPSVQRRAERPAAVRWIVEPLKAFIAGLTGALMALFGMLFAVLPLLLIIGAIGGLVYLIVNG
jgi:hypothetical protein